MAEPGILYYKPPSGRQFRYKKPGPFHTSSPFRERARVRVESCLSTTVFCKDTPSPNPLPEGEGTLLENEKALITPDTKGDCRHLLLSAHCLIQTGPARPAVVDKEDKQKTAAGDNCGGLKVRAGSPFRLDCRDVVYCTRLGVTSAGTPPTCISRARASTAGITDAIKSSSRSAATPG